MEEEIDLRPYFLAFQKYYVWILITGVLGGVACFILALNLPQTFEASSIVAVATNNENFIQFDPRIRTDFEPQPINAYPELALSDTLLSNLLSHQNIGFDDAESLRSKLNASITSNGELLKLTAQSNNPAEAARLVNLWSESFINWSNNFYLSESEGTLRFFEDQLAINEQILSNANQTLIEFQSLNQSSVISTTLKFNEEKHASSLLIQQELQTLLTDISNYKEYLQSTSTAGNPNLTIADQLSNISLQLRSFNSGSASQSPLILQLDTLDNLGTLDTNTQIRHLDAISILIEEDITALDTEISELVPVILDLQTRLQESESEYMQLKRNRDLAEEAVVTLARKVQEEQIIYQDKGDDFRIISQAAVPTLPIGPQTVLIVAVGTVLGVLVGILAIIIWGSKRIRQQSVLADQN